MRAAGMTYEEIGKVLGMSRQRVHQIASGKRRGVGDYFHPTAVEKIPYVGLRNWMLDNRVSISELNRRCGARALNSKYGVKRLAVAKLLEITGLTFEECFRRDDK